MINVDEYAYDIEFPGDLLDEYSRIAHGHDNWTMDHDGYGNIIITFWKDKGVDEDGE